MLLYSRKLPSNDNHRSFCRTIRTEISNRRGRMENKRIFLPAPEKAAFRVEPFDETLREKEVLAQMDWDVISAGTELAYYKALPNTWGVESGFPVYPGYSASGHVIAVGREVKNVHTGDRILLNAASHCLYTKLNESAVIPIPDGVDMKEAAFAFLSTFPFLSIRKLELEIGEAVMVAGLGLLGQFAIQIAKLAGACPVMACDFSPERRELALQLGADLVFDPREPDFMEKVKAATGGKGPEAVVEVTGHIAGLQQALEYVAFEGRIALLGCTRVSDQYIDFYKYVHRRGIRLLGCHNHARPRVESRPGEWTSEDDCRTYLKLLKAGRLRAAPLIGQTVSPAEAETLYAELAASGNPTLGVLLDWNRVK